MTLRLARSAPTIFLCLLLAARAQSCQLTTGANGLCASFRLEPEKASLHVGETLIVRVNPGACAGGPCTCDPPASGLRWQSSAPGIATVDSTGTVRAIKEGSADIDVIASSPSAGPGAVLHLAVVP
jgi:uncharacterized protein YjdB